MPRVTQAILIADWSCPLSVSRRRDVWADRKKEMNGRIWRPNDKRRKTENFQYRPISSFSPARNTTGGPDNEGENRLKPEREEEETKKKRGRTILTLIARSLSPAFASMLRPRWPRFRSRTALDACYMCARRKIKLK
jgi:hypothetical protein